MNIPPLLTLTDPATAESDALRELAQRLAHYAVANDLHERYYEGDFKAQRFGFSIPPAMRNLRVHVGWGGTVVDVLDQRLDLMGWRGDGDLYGLPGVFAQNQLAVESGQAHLDALVFGTAFVAVGSGGAGESSPLITVQSPRSMVAIWDARTRRVSQAASFTYDGRGQIATATLYGPDQTATFELRKGQYRAIDRDFHNLGRVPVVQIRNRPRAADTAGRSEITPAIRYYTDHAARTLLGMEVHREFYQAPQRWAMNVDPSDFVAEDGTPADPWQSIQGRLWAVPPNAEGEDSPTVGQFTPASPAPYIDQIKHLALMLAAEAGIPATYLGFATDNPASADAIRAGESGLIKRAERRQVAFGASWLEVARLSLLVRDGSVPDDFDSAVSVRWRDAATPTRAAAADEAVKLVGAKVLLPDSTVTYDRVGLDPDEQRQIAADKAAQPDPEPVAPPAIVDDVPRAESDIPTP